MPADDRLFAYGSLMFPEVWLHVVGHESPSIPVTLPGHLAYRVRGYSFPGLIKTAPGDVAPGLMYSGLDAEDWRRLDAFEDTFYRRLPVEVQAEDGQNHTVWAYVVPPEARTVLSDEVWTGAWFEKNALGDFLDRICGFEP